jgi:hypothetical protein
MTTSDEIGSRTLGPPALWAVAAVVGVAWLLWDGVSRIAAHVAAGRVDLAVQLAPDGAIGRALTAPSGARIAADGTVSGSVAAGDVADGAVMMLRTAEVVQLACWVAVVVLGTAFVLRFDRGRLFRRGTERLLTWLSVAVFAVTVAPFAIRWMATNWAIASLGWHDAPWPRPVGVDLLPAYLIAVLLTFVQVAFRRAARMARDQEGLV